MNDSTIDLASLRYMSSGLERFSSRFEDNINVSINTAGGDDETPTEPEEIQAETTEAVEDATDANDTANDIEETVDTAEMVFRDFDEMQNYLYVARTQGVNRTFLALVNYNGNLAKALDIYLPACESLSFNGDPYDRLTEKVVVGLEGFGQSIVDFIKKVCNNIISLVGRFMDFIRRVFFSAKKNLARLKKSFAELKGATPKAESKATIHDPKQLTTLLSQITDGMKMSESEYSTLQHVNINVSLNSAAKKEMDLSSVPASDISALLGASDKLLLRGEAIEKVLTKARDTAKKNLSEAKKAEGNEEELKKLKEEVRTANQRLKYATSGSKNAASLVNKALSTAAIWIRAAARNKPESE